MRGTKKTYREEDLGDGWHMTIWLPVPGQSYRMYEVGKVNESGYFVHGTFRVFCRRRDAMAHVRDHRQPEAS